MTDEYNDKIKETKILQSLIVEEDRSIQVLKEDIRKMNKKISDVDVKIIFFKFFTFLNYIFLLFLERKRFYKIRH
jgi:hypothetical protein